MKKSIKSLKKAVRKKKKFAVHKGGSNVFFLKAAGYLYFTF
jgi:hypothetical protein